MHDRDRARSVAAHSGCVRAGGGRGTGGRSPGVRVMGHRWPGGREPAEPRVRRRLPADRTALHGTARREVALHLGLQLRGRADQRQPRFRGAGQPGVRGREVAGHRRVPVRDCGLVREPGNRRAPDRMVRRRRRGRVLPATRTQVPEPVDVLQQDPGRQGVRAVLGADVRGRTVTCSTI